MISMQRSLSSPVCVQASPPASPSDSRPSSRSPVQASADLQSPIATPRLRSRSPTKPPALQEYHVTLPMRRAHDTSSQQGRQSPAKGASPIIMQKPIIDQAVLPGKGPEDRIPRTHASAEEGLPALPSTAPVKAPQPLLGDPALYANTNINLEQDGTTLEELAHLVRLSKYQERKRASTRVRLQRNLISSALSARLTKCGEITLRNLAECFRNEDKKGFASLFNAIHDVRSSCDETRSFAVLEPEMDSLRAPGASSSSGNPDTPVGTFGAMSAGQSVVPFLNDISASAREAFLNFLTQLRTNPDYLASRLSSLTASEIQALTVFHKGLEPIEPVMPSFNRAGARGNAGSAGRGSSNQLNAVERLLSFQRHDPLSALIYTCFANSAGPDSAEDRRRTDVWAAACARLVQNKAHHSVLTSVLNVWSTMRDWAGRSNMELYLMKILEDGAFLLDRAEDPNGTRFNLSTWTTKDNAAMEEFYENAVDGLFEILDDEDATGIPEGVIELGNAILRRVDNKLVEEVRRWLVYQWLFTNWLFAVIIHPESYGMMAEYHITEYGRQKVLKQVAHRAQKPVLDMLMSSYKSKPDPVSPKIQGHIQNILGRFRPSRTTKTARLLPARSITSLRETAEVHPYLVISPADLLTLVNALFPEKRPQSGHMSSIRSGAPSLSGFSAISQPVSIGTSRSNNFETASIASFSASSVLSDAATSRELSFEQQTGGSPQRYSPPFLDLASQRPSVNYEDDGYRLRLAMHEMVQTLGADVVAGSCHPCAERWAVLFISSNGSNLSLQMTYDPDEDLDEENSSTTSETEDEEVDRPELDNDYHLLRDSILKLVEDFEIPRNLDDDGSKITLSNRASGLKRYKSKNKIVLPESSMGSRNPYRPRVSQDDLSALKSPSPTVDENDVDATPQPVLVTMLIAASSQSRVQSDFVGAHLYWRTLQQLNALGSSSLRKNGFAALLNIFARGPRDSIRRSASATEEYDAWLIWLKQSQERHEGLLDTMMKRLRGLRDKMWYKTDVHNSQPYEDIRCHCTALKIMGVPSKWDSYKRNRAQMSRGLSANFLYQNESQTLDLLAAAEEQGGPNKLRDDQADKTSRWLEQYGIENFCRGEERIHRFCCEVDTCISKLVAEQVMDSPVLWSSELFARDRAAFGGPRVAASARERESYYIDEDVVSVVSGHGRRYTSSSTRPGSVARDLRSVTSFNLSQISVDSSRFAHPRHSAAMSDILDAHEYFGVASPVHSIDPTTTYWSPFQSTMPSAASAMSTTSRAHSPTTSLTNLSSPFSHPFSSVASQSGQARPGTSASSNETVHQQRISDEKQQFLSDLRQTLTSLLLSDLGNLVFSRGSETDSWFNDLGQQCIEREEAQAARAPTKAAKTDRNGPSAPKPRVIEKKKSFGDLRGAGESAIDTTSNHGAGGPSQGPEPSKTVASSSSTTKSRNTVAKDGSSDFPYKKAYQRLFRMFCVHPNPHVKLSALFELKNLVEASLLTSGRKNKWARQRQLGMQNDQQEHGGHQRAIEQTIDSVKERRSHASQPVAPHPWGSRFPGASDTKSIMSVMQPNTDAVANMLLSLFKDSQIRPKTLFRDLQFISSFVPPSILDRSEKGRAFWDTGLAALTLKQDVCRTMANTAYEIIDLDQQSRKPAAASTVSAGDKEDKGVGGGGKHSLSPRDAARMYSITAKEGDPMAQRELALLILTRHELVADRSTLPLAKPRDVFKQAVMDNFGGGGSSGGRSGVSSARHVGERVRSTFSGSVGSGAGGGGSGGGGGSTGGLSSSSSSSAPGLGGPQDVGGVGDVRPDPSLMCVAFHWMETAAQGGDAQAKQFLVDNDMRMN